LQENNEYSKIEKKVTSYISDRYGSIHAFRLLKYFIEHRLARERKGLAVYEVAFNIPPSAVLTRYALVRIECLADGSERSHAESGLDQLLKKGILKCDPETNILELDVPMDSVVNVYLKDVDTGFEVASDPTSAYVVLLWAGVRLIPEKRKKTEDEEKRFGAALPDWAYLDIPKSIAGMPDVVYLDKRSRKAKIIELKFWTPLG